MLPKPLPFMRLGIANLPILLAVDLLPFKWFVILAAAKVVGMSIVSGTLFSYVALFSVAGTMVAALVMRGIRRVGKQSVSLIGVSIAGAIMSNAIQMLIARFVIFGEVAWLIAPLFLLTGLVTGTLMGFFAEFFVEHSTWYACAMGSSTVLDMEAPAESDLNSAEHDRSTTSKKRDSTSSTRRAARRQRYEAMLAPNIAALLGVVLAIVFLLQQNTVVKAIFLVVFILWTWFAGKRFSLMSTLLVIVGIVFANLLIPSGKVLWKIGPLSITYVALMEGISEALTFEGLMYLSKATILPELHFPGRFGAIIAQAFRYYDRIIEYRGKVRAKTVVHDIDALMQRVWMSERL
jgi:heptaprenyl diphosphate synthase